MTRFPLDAEEINLTWQIDEGGIGVTAFTDAAGLPYIGLYPLNPYGRPKGPPSHLQRKRLMTNVVAGFRGRHPIVVFIDAEATLRGLALTVCPPLSIAKRGYERHKFTAWSIDAARYALTVYPANTNGSIIPYGREGSYEETPMGSMEEERLPLEKRLSRS